MKEIRKVKERAEEYLHKVVNKSWNNLVNIEKDKYIPEGWPIQLDAHVYLGHKYKNFIPEFAIKIRNLWLNWAKWYENEDHKYGRYKFFWPATDEFSVPINHENAQRDMGYEIETHISMFRAKENLKIIGFETYFNEAKRRLGDLLLEDISYYGKKVRILWQIIRSPYLCRLLQDYIKTITLKLFEERKIDKIFRYENNNFREDFKFLSKMSFFLIISNLKEEYFDNAQRILLRLIDMQDEKGSFFNDILSTCLIISAIEISNLDSLKIVSERAIDWILNEQTTQGSWPHPQISWSYDTPELDILSTVLVLETIDLITDDKPLPIWVEKLEKDDNSKERKSARIQIHKSLNIPEGITWSDIFIYFISPDSVEIRAGKPLGVKNFIEMGFKDRRSVKPDLIWETLKTFAKYNGEISWSDRGIAPRINKNLKSYIKDVRKRLKFLFGIEDDPFYPYDRKAKAYRLKSSISQRDGCLD